MLGLVAGILALAPLVSEGLASCKMVDVEATCGSVGVRSWQANIHYVHVDVNCVLIKPITLGREYAPTLHRGNCAVQTVSPELLLLSVHLEVGLIA